jgi:hypothetical protein
VQSPRRARQWAAKIKSWVIKHWQKVPASLRIGSRQALRWLGTLATLTLAGILAALLAGHL